MALVHEDAHMSKRFLYALMLAAPLGLLTAACGGDDADERAALEEDELTRDLDLALQGDTLSTTFEDTATVDPAPGPDANAPAPRPTTQQPPRQTPAPRPSPQQPQREQPRESPQPQQPSTVTRSA